MVISMRRRRCPPSRSAAAMALVTFAVHRSDLAPAAEAWAAGRGGAVVGRRAVLSPLQLPPQSATTNGIVASRPHHRYGCPRCRPRREWESITAVDLGGAAQGDGIRFDGGGGHGLFGRPNAASRVEAGGPGGRRAGRRRLGSRIAETTDDATAAGAAFPWRRRGFRRRLAAGLIAATVLSWLCPRVAAAATAAAATAAEGLAGSAAAAEAASAVAVAATAEAATAVAGAGAGAAASDAAAAATAAAASSAAAHASSLIRPLGTLQVLPTRAEVELSMRLLFAALGGAAVGLERSSSDRPAGVRTMALVSLGAAAFTLCSMYGFMSVGALVGPDGPTTKYDPSRMASNVASGVGFIGAGVITNNRKAAGVYDRQSTVGGLTTAAAIWTSAAIGVANGVGLYFIGATAALSTILILRFGHLKHGHFFGGGEQSDVVKAGSSDVKVGSKKKKKAEASSLSAAASPAAADGDKVVANATSWMEGLDSTAAASKPTAAFAGDGIAQPKHGSIDARLEEMSAQEDAGEDISSGENARPSDHRAAVEIEKVVGVGGSDAVPSEEGDAILEIQSPPKEKKRKKESSTTKKESPKKKKESPTFMDSPPLPLPSTADPLLEKYLWGVDNGDDELSSNGEPSHKTHSIEEDQEVVYRDGRRGSDKARGEGREGSGSP